MPDPARRRNLRRAEHPRVVAAMMRVGPGATIERFNREIAAELGRPIHPATVARFRVGLGYPAPRLGGSAPHLTRDDRVEFTRVYLANPSATVRALREAYRAATGRALSVSTTHNQLKMIRGLESAAGPILSPNL